MPATGPERAEESHSHSAEGLQRLHGVSAGQLRAATPAAHTELASPAHSRLPACSLLTNALCRREETRCFTFKGDHEASWGQLCPGQAHGEPGWVSRARPGGQGLHSHPPVLQGSVVGPWQARSQRSSPLLGAGAGPLLDKAGGPSSPSQPACTSPHSEQALGAWGSGTGSHMASRVRDPSPRGGLHATQSPASEAGDLGSRDAWGSPLQGLCHGPYLPQEEGEMWPLPGDDGRARRKGQRRTVLSQANADQEATGLGGWFVSTTLLWKAVPGPGPSPGVPTPSRAVEASLNSLLRRPSGAPLQAPGPLLSKRRVGATAMCFSSRWPGRPAQGQVKTLGLPSVHMAGRGPFPSGGQPRNKGWVRLHPPAPTKLPVRQQTRSVSQQAERWPGPACSRALPDRGDFQFQGPGTGEG